MSESGVKILFIGSKDVIALTYRCSATDGSKSEQSKVAAALSILSIFASAWVGAACFILKP